MNFSPFFFNNLIFKHCRYHLLNKHPHYICILLPQTVRQNALLACTAAKPKRHLCLQHQTPH
jgi:hypothetical protein